MKAFLERLEQAADLREIQSLVDHILDAARTGGKPEEKRRFLRDLLFNRALLSRLETPAAIDALLASTTPDEWEALFGAAVAQELSQLTVDLVDGLVDLDHRQLLRLLPPQSSKTLLQVLKRLNTYLEECNGSDRYLRGMRVARIMADIYRTLADEPRVWRRALPPCCIDGQAIVQLKEAKQIDKLAAAYEARINQLQSLDLQRSLAALDSGRAAAPRMIEAAYEQTFCIQAPLRLGISSANASDNHLRSKEQGGKTLNIAVNLQQDREERAQPPLQVTARRLPEPQLILRSRSRGFKADFEASKNSSTATVSELFFAYRRSGDEALRLVKQGLVHAGIVRPDSTDVIEDIAAFTGGGGLKITTSSKVLQGSGLGTSGILSAAILKMLYHLSGHPYAAPACEYPGLYDQSLMLEQSLGLNSGWQDARGASGGPAAIKNFYAPPTDGLPAPERTFLTEVDERLFTERVVLFDTGISRSATRGLNVVLDAYLSRDSQRYAAIRESLAIHDEMVAALCAGAYADLGQLANRYWQLRCILDPQATNDALQYLFENPQITNLTEGRLLTGAGGGGFALLIAAEGQAAELRARLDKLRQHAAFANSRVVSYQLNAQGIHLA
ncbi:MAG: hypothetical protein J4F35_11460 [Candidatus Latescibacteria bacterium]|nr:hypothetical protein [Candidatus Latescibacterota bacterium]